MGNYPVKKLRFIRETYRDKRDGEFAFRILVLYKFKSFIVHDYFHNADARHEGVSCIR